MREGQETALWCGFPTRSKRVAWLAHGPNSRTISKLKQLLFQCGVAGRSSVCSQRANTDKDMTAQGRLQDSPYYETCDRSSNFDQGNIS